MLFATIQQSTPWARRKRDKALLAQLSQQQARMLAEDWGRSFSSCHGEPDFLGSQNRVTKGFTGLAWSGWSALASSRLGIGSAGVGQRPPRPRFDPGWLMA